MIRRVFLPVRRPASAWVYCARPGDGQGGPARLFRASHRAIAWAQQQADLAQRPFIIEAVQPRAVFCCSVYPDQDELPQLDADEPLPW